MANRAEKNPEYVVKRGRVLFRDGEPWLIIAIPQAFFSGEPGPDQAEADRLADRIAYMLTEYGE